MTDLSHWNFAAYFYGYEAAALILGLEPEDSEDQKRRINVVIDRMGLHYMHASKRYYYETLGPSNENPDAEANYPFELVSVKMDELLHLVSFDDDEECPLFKWLASDQSQFEHQVFSRDAVALWLEAIGMNSIYQFTLNQLSVSREANSRWPWGNHHTKLLGHLEAAARRYWVNYDPAEATTASTNETVVEWLVAERKVSRTKAEAIASMLRPDGLPTGPRK
jgi:hypothetical protein